LLASRKCTPLLYSNKIVFTPSFFLFSLNALQAVCELGVDSRQVLESTFPEGDDFKEPVSYQEFEERGQAEMHLAFCHKYPRLRERMAELHPALDKWMVDTVWGRLRSRPGLGSKERQLCALAALAGNIVWPQFKSSIIGNVVFGLG
jgi:alkylhydroperoxidase/carboxymuconolactone decarboxylase family protein YurZ